MPTRFLANVNSSIARMKSLIKYIGLILTLASLNAHAREPIKLAVLTASPPSVIDASILTEVYRQAGIPMILVTLPGLRSSAEADMGHIDGEVARVDSYGEQHPNLIRIDPAIDALSISAYYKKSLRANIKSKSDLKNYSIGYVKGLKSPSDMVKHFPKASATHSSKSLVKMLEANRFDVIVNNDSSTDFYIDKLGLKEIEKVELSREPLHHYLHQNHRDLAPILSAIIKKMAASGELIKLRAKAEKELLLSSAPPE